MLPALLLVLSLSALAWFVRGDRGEYRGFKQLTDSVDRRRRYRRWITRAWLAFALPAFIALIALSRGEAVLTLPSEFAGLAARLPAIGGPTFLLGLFGGTIGGLMVAVLLARRGGRQPPVLGDIDAILPRNRTEAGHTAALALTAGVTEELAFRLSLPLLFVLVGLPPLAAFVLAALLFAAMHLYQGWAGVAISLVLGAVLSLGYLASGSLALMILVHAVIDLNGLVVRPLLSGRWRLTA